MKTRSVKDAGWSMDLVVERLQEAMRLLRRVMKRSVILSMILILDAAVAFAQAEPSSTHVSNRLLGDAVRMTKGGLSDATIVAYVRARRASLDSILSADDLIRLRRAGVSETVIQYFVGAAAVDMGLSGEGRDEEVTYDSREAGAYPVEPAYDGDYAYPYGYTYDPPYYGGPSSTSVVFVRERPFFRRHFFFRRRSFAGISAIALSSAHSSPGAGSAASLVRAARFSLADRGWLLLRCEAGALWAFACRVGAAHDRKLDSGNPRMLCRRDPKPKPNLNEKGEVS